MKKKIILLLIITIPFVFLIYYYLNFAIDDYRWIFIILIFFYVYRKSIDIISFKSNLDFKEILKFYIPFYSYFKK